MRTRVVATVSNSSKVINKDNNQDNKVNKVNAASRVNAVRKVNKHSRDNRANKVRTVAVSRASKDRKAISKEANRPAARKTADSQTLTGNAAGSIAAARWAATGATIANFPPRFANVCAKRRICDVSGAPLESAPGVSMK